MLSAIIAMSIFSFVMSISPGPINLIIVSSGANYGIKKTMSFVSGATIGFTLLLMFVGFGFIKIIQAYPILFNYLSFAGSAFILYIGYKIVSAPSSQIEVKNNENIPKFYEGFLLQWLNPKAWIAAASGISMFSSTNNHLLAFIVIYFLICYACLSVWAILGNATTMLLKFNNGLSFFNKGMGLVLIATACYLIYLQFVNMRGMMYG